MAEAGGLGEKVVITAESSYEQHHRKFFANRFHVSSLICIDLLLFENFRARHTAGGSQV